jgi:hypothetical protein
MIFLLSQSLLYLSALLSWEEKEGRKDLRDLIAKSDSENELLASEHLRVQDVLEDHDDDEILPE